MRKTSNVGHTHTHTYKLQNLQKTKDIIKFSILGKRVGYIYLWNEFVRGEDIEVVEGLLLLEEETRRIAWRFRSINDHSHVRGHNRVFVVVVGTIVPKITP